MASTEVTRRRRSVPGDPERGSAPQPAAGGWHPAEWASELAGTAFQLLAGFSVVAFMMSGRSPAARAIPSTGLRLVLVGAAFGALAAIVAVSPLGRRSGAHLNPAVTFGFWLRGHVHRHDLVGYAVAQTLGALLASWLFVVIWGPWADDVNDARTLPAGWLGGAAAVGIEAGLTAFLLLVVFNLLSSPRTARWTPLVMIGVLAFLIRVGAPYTSASMNPARTLGPAVAADGFGYLWVYFLGPPLGALIAAGLFKALLPERRTLTAKLFHDHRYPTTMKSQLPAQPAQPASGSRRAPP